MTFPQSSWTDPGHHDQQAGQVPALDGGRAVGQVGQVRALVAHQLCCIVAAPWQQLLSVASFQLCKPERRILGVPIWDSCCLQMRVIRTSCKFQDKGEKEEGDVLNGKDKDKDGQK